MQLALGDRQPRFGELDASHAEFEPRGGSELDRIGATIAERGQHALPAPVGEAAAGGKRRVDTFADECEADRVGADRAVEICGGGGIAAGGCRELGRGRLDRESAAGARRSHVAADIERADRDSVVLQALAMGLKCDGEVVARPRQRRLATNAAAQRGKDGGRPIGQHAAQALEVGHVDGRVQSAASGTDAATRLQLGAGELDVDPGVLQRRRADQAAGVAGERRVAEARRRRERERDVGAPCGGEHAGRGEFAVEARGREAAELRRVESARLSFDGKTPRAGEVEPPAADELPAAGAGAKATDLD